MLTSTRGAEASPERWTPWSDRRLRDAIAALVVVFAWLAFTVPSGGYDGDLDHWVRWSHRIARFGLANVYGGVSESANYLPVFMWVLAGLNRIAGGPLTSETVQLVKVAALAFDFGLGVALAAFLASRGRNPALAILVVANPATLYDSWVWGQIDAMHTAFVVGAWLALARGSAAWAASLFLLALNTKLQSVVFLPFFLFALVHVLGTRWRAWLRAAAACAAVQVALLAPFMRERALRALWSNTVGIVGYFQAISLNAYNVWYLVAPDRVEAEDTELLFHATYRTWGVAMFALALVVIAVPFATSVRRLWRERRLERLDEDGFLLLGLVGVAFFAFPTEVHERFLHPAVVLLGVDAVLRGRYLAYGVASAAYVLNLEGVLRWRGLRYDSLAFEPRAIAAVVLAVFAAGAVDAYRRVASVHSRSRAR
jgi:Gpi18-like mannosyltransferase